MKRTIITLSLLAVAGAAHATNTPAADCVGRQACQTNSGNTSLTGGNQRQQQQQYAAGGNATGGDANVSSYIAPNTSLSTGGYVYNNRTLSIRPVQAVAPAAVAPSAFVSRMVDPSCGPRQVVVAEDVHGRVIGVFRDTMQTIGEDHYLRPSELPYRTVEIMPGLRQLIGHRVHETTAVVTTSASGAFAFGANGSSGAGGSIGGASAGAFQRMVTTIRLQECVAYELTDAPKPTPAKRRPAKRKPCSTCGRNTAQAAAQQAVSVTVNIAKDQPAK